MSGHSINLAGQLQAMSEDVWPTSAHPDWFQGKHTGLSWQLDQARPLTQRADIDYERRTVREGDEMKGQKQERRRKQRRWPPIRCPPKYYQYDVCRVTSFASDKHNAASHLR